MTNSEKIKILRKYLKMTTAEIANTLSVTLSNISKIENDRQKPTIDMLTIIVRR